MEELSSVEKFHDCLLTTRESAAQSAAFAYDAKLIFGMLARRRHQRCR
jgi:hypothetical protein